MMLLNNMIAGFVVLAACGGTAKPVDPSNKAADTAPADVAPADVERASATTKKYAFEAYPSWAVSYPDKECPASLVELDEFMPPGDHKDPWGGAYAMFCGASLPPGAKGLAVMSPGPDGKADTADDVTSWK